MIGQASNTDGWTAARRETLEPLECPKVLNFLSHYVNRCALISVSF
jgi:hypothetical protein